LLFLNENVKRPHFDTDDDLLRAECLTCKGIENN